LAAFLSLHLPLSEKLHFVGALPFAHGIYEFESRGFDIYVKESESAMENVLFINSVSRQMWDWVMSGRAST
jgi:hypothetical protein